jgi:hypothetical protein
VVKFFVKKIVCLFVCLFVCFGEENLLNQVFSKRDLNS